MVMRVWLLGDVAAAAGGQEESQETRYGGCGAVQRPEMAAHVVPRTYICRVSTRTYCTLAASVAVSVEHRSEHLSVCLSVCVSTRLSGRACGGVSGTCAAVAACDLPPAYVKTIHHHHHL